jgi:hypothetical protein
MANIIGNAILWAGTLWTLEYFSGAVSSVMAWMKAKVAWILASSKVWALWSVVWSAAPFALWAGSIYSWVKEYKKADGLAKWVYKWTEKWLLTYWIPVATLWAFWLISSPLAIPILTAWAWMYWVRKLWTAGIEVAKKAPEFVASLPWKAGSLAWKGVKKLFSRTPTRPANP